MDFIKHIRQLIRSQLKDQTIIGKVISVDPDAGTCDVSPVNGSADLLGVLLRAVVNSETTGLVILPKVDSDVLVSIIHNNDAQSFISQFSEFEEILIEQKVDGETVFKWQLNSDGELSVDSEKITFNGGDNGGIVNIGALTTEVAKNSAFLAALKASFDSWIVAPTDGGAALKLIIVPALSGQVTADLSGITDNNILH